MSRITAPRAFTFGLTAALAVAAALVSAPASAAVQVFDFTAVRTAVSATPAPAPGGVTAAAFAGPSTITGRFSYDTSVAPSSSGATFAWYQTGAFVINEFSTAGLTLPFETLIANDDGGFDGFSMRGAGFASGTGDRLEIILMSSDQSMFSSTALPTALIFSLFSDARLFLTSFQIVGVSVVGLGQASYRFTSISQVPLPAALPLFLAGLAGLGVIRRRKAA